MGFKPLDASQSLAISYTKAVGITLVVIGHYPKLIFSIYSPYSFHMPLFFFLGGYLFSARKSGVRFMGDVVGKYFLYIVYTYVLIGVFAIVFKHFYPEVNIGTPFHEGVIETVQMALGRNMHNNRLFLVAWFLFSYVFVLVAFRTLWLVLSQLKDDSRAAVILTLAIIFAWAGMGLLSPYFREYVAQKIPAPQHVNLACQVVVGLSFYMFGWLARYKSLKFDSLFVFILLSCLIYAFREWSLLTGMVMSWSDYRDGVLMSLFQALSGIYAVFFISTILAKGAGRMAWFKRIGDESKMIMSYHLAAFLLLDYVFYKFGLYNLVNAGADHYKFQGSLAVYTVVGVALPILVLLAYGFIVSRARRALALSAARGNPPLFSDFQK